VRIDSSPVYLDTSALAKLYVPEPGSDVLEAALLGRRDLLVSDLTVTELTSALARRAREGDLDHVHARRVYAALLRDLADGQYRWVEATREVHRDAERLLLGASRRAALRAADAMHLALANIVGARVLISYDARMKAAAALVPSFTVAP
jgi:predicted nucleic acid-binding protein